MRKLLGWTRLRNPAESGSTLVMACVTITVVALTFTSLLSFENATSRAQGALAGKRTYDLAGDGAIDAAIAKVTTDPDVGVYDMANAPNPESNADGPCKKFTALPHDANLALDSNNNGNPTDDNDVTVTCSADRESGTPGGSAGNPANSVILALGGVYGDGNDSGESPNPHIPFCDDWESKSGQCESGIFIGQGAGQSATGGLLVVSNNNQGGGQASVISNSSIIAKDGAKTNNLNVVGTVSARRACVNVFENFVVGGSAGNAPSGCAGGAAVNNAFNADPAWRHGLWDAVDPAKSPRDSRGLQTAAASTPGGPGGFTCPITSSTTAVCEVPPAIVPPSPLAANAWDPSDWTRWDPEDTASRPAAVNYLQPTLTELATVTRICNDHFVDFKPGWYRSLQPLNKLMTSCPATTTYWFEPGIYYFDFNDIDSALSGSLRYWRVPTQFSQMIGGTPLGWVPPVPSKCATNPCVQPEKTMVPLQLTPDTPWTTAAINATVAANGNVIDGKVSEISLTGSNNSANLTQPAGKLQTQIPVQDGVTKVDLAFKETHDGSFKADYPRLRIQVNGLSSAWCELRIDSQYGTPDAVDATIRHFDLTNGCPSGPERIGVGSGFPAGVNDPSGPQDNKKWNPDAVNGLNTEYQVQRVAGWAAPAPPPHVVLDGIEFRVAYKGQPAPAYPNGCDARGQGVEWIFGDLSRMRFDTNNVYAELCTSAEMKDPGQHGIGIYGLAGPHLSGNGTDPTAYITDTPPPRQQASSVNDDLCNGQPGSCVSVRTGLAGSTTWVGNYQIPNARDNVVDQWEKIGDGVNAYADMIGSSSITNFTVPTNFIPAGSRVEGVRIRIHHAEPRTAAGGTISSLNLDVSPTAAPDQSDPDSGTTTFPTQHPAVYQPFIAPLGWFATDANGAYSGAATYAIPAASGMYTYGAVGDPSTLTATEKSEQATLTSTLRTASSLNGAVIKITAFGTSGLTIFDGIEVTVAYRPPGQLRPLRGCTTIRTLDVAGNVNYRGSSWIHNGNISAAGGKWVTDDDAAYDDGTGTSLTTDCALLLFGSKSSDQGAKLHIVGDIYAPTAAFDFSGKQNQASFVTDGVVARHLTTLRWTDDPNAEPIPAYGCCNTAGRDPRIMTFTARATATGKLLDTVKISVDDGDGTPGQAAKKITIISWKRGP